MSGSEHMADSIQGSVVINETTIPDADIWSAVGEVDPSGLGDVERALVNWGRGTRKNGSIFDRDRFVTPDKTFHQFKMAMDAAESDDVVSGIVETTEALAYNKISMTCDDEDEEDVWNQIIDDLDLVTRMREMWREMFIVSQFYCGIMWGRKTYTVRGTGTSRKRRKSYDLVVPIGLTMFDPMTILPVGSFMFRKDQLVYIADKTQAGTIDQVLAGDNSTDMVVDQFLKGRYTMDRSDRNRLQQVTGADYLEGTFLMNDENVFRHTATRPDYQRFATVRMKSVFELLDLKQQLRQMDRAHLLGGTNFIIVFKRGSDKLPANGSALSSLKTQVQNAARVPVIIGDHTIDVEIITPKLDKTMLPERYNTLDARITARLYQIMMTGNYSAGAKGDDSIKLARLIARSMESRRGAIGDIVFKNVLLKTFERNVPQFKNMPKLNFHPKRIALDFDATMANYMLDLRDRGDISRETILKEIDLDQDDEHRLRKRESVEFDKVFQPTNVPFGAAGRAGGGNANGGGANRNAGRPAGSTNTEDEREQESDDE